MFSGAAVSPPPEPAPSALRRMAGNGLLLSIDVMVLPFLAFRAANRRCLVVCLEIRNGEQQARIERRVDAVELGDQPPAHTLPSERVMRRVAKLSRIGLLVDGALFQ